MQEKRDNIDFLLERCFEDISINDSYNSALMDKIENKKLAMESALKNKISLRISAASLIMGGLMILILGMPEVQYRLVDYQCRVKNAEAFIQYNYNQDILKYIKGE
jgi:hypothetical protein